MSPQVSPAATSEPTGQDDLSGPPPANRHRLPDERSGITHHFSIAGHEGYLTVGLYPNGRPGEVLIRMAKEGSTIAGFDGVVRHCGFSSAAATAATSANAGEVPSQTPRTGVSALLDDVYEAGDAPVCSRPAAH